MKFHTSHFVNFDGTPKPWCDYGLDEESTVRRYFENHVRVWDADNCGDRRVEFVFENGRAFVLEYSWWIDLDPEWELRDEREVTEVDLSEIKVAMHRYRDVVGNPHDARLREFVV